MLLAAILAFELRIPASTAYCDPKETGIKIAPGGVTFWEDASQSLVWIGELQSGELTAQLETDASGLFTLEIDGQRQLISSKAVAKFNIKAPGYRKLWLKQSSGSININQGVISGLILKGKASEGARFNLTDRGNAASVHLKYPLKNDEPVEWFYNEIRPKTDPLHAYYEACGFHRGYFGIQVNSARERRIIFSVWDAGDVPDERSKVSKENLVQLLDKGEGVEASGFGNEGTGGHSHLNYMWKTSDTHRFLVHAVPKGTSTIYTGYYFFNETKKWKMIAKFKAPKDGKYQNGLYSFNENFWGTTGHKQFHAEFGPAWVMRADGTWRELLDAKFSHDSHGKENRRDYAAGTKDDRWFLSNGGAFANGVKFGDTLTRMPSKAGPPDELPEQIVKLR